MLGTILENEYGITRWLDFGTELGYLDGSFDSSNVGYLEGILIGESMVCTYGKVLVSDEGIKLISTAGKVLGTVLVNVDGITLGLDVRTYLGLLDGYFDGFNDEKLEGLFLGY